MQQSCELHLHTDYSLLDGLNSADEYMARANEIGMTHMAITDHGTLSGHRAFQRAAKEAGITPILGCEMYFSATDRFDRRAKAKRQDGTQTFNHIIVLAQNENGLHNLNRMSEIAWTEGLYNKPRIDFDVLEENSDDLIVLSGCLNGVMAKALAEGNMDEAVRWGEKFKSILGDRFFIEIQGHNPKDINLGLLEVGNRLGIRPVVTSDCHYAREEDLWIEQAMLILATSPKPAKEFDFTKSQKMEMLARFNYAYPDRSMNFEEYQIFLRGAEQHRAMLDKQGISQEAIDNTMVVANMVGDYPYHEGLDLLPKPKNGNPDDILEKKAQAGLKRIGKQDDPVYSDRLREELDIVKDMNFSTYFLIEANTISWARSKGIRVGPGRGSGAGSLLNYCLGITNVDPIEHKLLFFRFLNPERGDWPDIDSDVEINRRSEVKAYMQRQFKHVASIATFGRFQGKKSIRDAARVFRVPLGDVNKALKGADWPAEVDFFEKWDKTKAGIEFNKKYPEVVKLAKFMLGRLNNQGMHAGGIVMSSEPLRNFVPIQTAKDNSDPSGARIPLVAVDMDEAAEIGLIKFDFLGLKALTIISETVKMIKDRHGIDVVPEDLPLDDKGVYQTLSEGYTKGVFQAEAVPYTNLLIKMSGVKNFDELVASNALVRPGAMNSTAGASYIARKKGEEMIEYHHPDMKWFTEDTYGVVIYQEQVMLTMTELAGMSMADADKVRKIIGKKKDVSEFEAYKAKFIEGASQKISKKKAEGLWHDFEAHAGYSFNKSHAVAYSMVSYWTAWLKQNYPLEFITAILKEEGDKDSLLDYLVEAKRLGLKVMLPHVNVSGKNFEIQSSGDEEYIRMGLSNIKFISDILATRLIEKRPYPDYKTLHDYVVEKGSGLSTRVLASMNAVGAAAFDDNPRTGNERDNFFEYLNIPAFNHADLPPRVKAQFRPLTEYMDDETFVVMGMVRGIKTGPGWARIEIVDEVGSAGIFTDPETPIEAGKMYVLLVSDNRVARFITVEDVLNDNGGAFQEFLEAESFPEVTDGLYKVISFKSRTTKAGKKMANVVLCDENKELTSALVFPANYTKLFVRCREGSVVDLDLATTKDGAVFISDIKENYGRELAAARR